MSYILNVKTFFKFLDLDQSQTNFKDRKIKEKLLLFAGHIEKLDFEAKPDYKFLKKLLNDCISFIDESPEWQSLMKITYTTITISEL
jgi:hypothetical protein